MVGLMDTFRSGMLQAMQLAVDRLWRQSSSQSGSILGHLRIAWAWLVGFPSCHNRALF